jgi:hypothetical protein
MLHLHLPPLALPDILLSFRSSWPLLNEEQLLSLPCLRTPSSRSFRTPMQDDSPSQYDRFIGPDRWSCHRQQGLAWWVLAEKDPVDNNAPCDNSEHSAYHHMQPPSTPVPVNNRCHLCILRAGPIGGLLSLSSTFQLANMGFLKII